MYITYTNLGIVGEIDKHLRIVNEDGRIRSARQDLIAQEDGLVACRQVNTHDLRVAAISTNNKGGRRCSSILLILSVAKDSATPDDHYGSRNDKLRCGRMFNVSGKFRGSPRFQRLADSAGN